MSGKIPQLSRQCILSYFLIGALISQNPVWADVANGIMTDGTMGPAQALSGANVIVPQSLGSTVGNNLFHSFTDFNIAQGQTVEFTGSNALQNVVSRVTGTHMTDIEGTLKSSIANAAFYLINPNGVTFGAGAQVDVPGAFHVSTADKIDFQNNGGVFYADRNQGSSLSSEAPAAFGFLGTSAANNGLIDVNGPHLAAKAGQTLDVVAGDIKVHNVAAVSSEAGEIRLVAMQGAGTASLKQADNGTLPLPDKAPSANNAGRITVDSSAVVTNGEGGGRIALWGGDTSFTADSKIFADNTGTTDAVSAKGVDIRSYSLNLDNSWVTFDTTVAGKAGTVAVETTGPMKIIHGGLITSTAWKQGNAGNVAVTADTLTIDSQGFTSSATGVLSQAEARSSGQAGNVSIRARILDILNGGLVSSSTLAQGDAGGITVTADTLRIDNQSNAPGKATGIISRANAASKGHAGSVTVKAGTFDILNGGIVTSSTSAQGNAGSIAVTADKLRIDSQGNSSGATGIVSAANSGSVGHAGNVTIKAGKFDILNGGVVSSSTFAQGDGGSVTITADALKIDGQGFLSSGTGIGSQAGPGSSGQGGNVSIQAGTLDILNRGIISTSTFAQGSAGSVIIQTGKANIVNGSYVSSISNGANSSGKTGYINVAANDSIHLDHGSISIQNQAYAALAAKITPGTITVTAPDIDMKNSEITANATGNVAAGKIVVNFSHWLTMDPSFISTTANTGNGGPIVINGGELIYLENSGFRTTVSGLNSNGGDIFTKANVLAMNTGLIQANAVGGSGGDINLDLNALIPSSNTLIVGGSTMFWEPSSSGLNVIQAASQAGVSGNVSVIAPQLNLSGVIANLGGPQFDTSIISQDYCELGTGSSLTRKGAGGLQPKSGDQLLF